MQSDCAYESGLLVSCSFFFFPLPPALPFFFFFFFNLDRYCLEDVLKAAENVSQENYRLLHTSRSASITCGLLSAPPPSFLIQPTILLFTGEVQRYSENMGKKKSNLIFWLYKNFVILRDALQKKKKKSKRKTIF